MHPVDSSAGQPDDPRRRRDGPKWLLAVVAAVLATRLSSAPGMREHRVTPGEPMVVGGDVLPPRLLMRVEPNLPERERRRTREQPRFLFELTIDHEGHVVQVRPVSTNDQSLLPYVTTAIKQWRYAPATYRGKPVAVRYTITFWYEVR
jgi:hypothetical protein